MEQKIKLVRCNAKKEQWCNEHQLDANIKCIHYDPHERNFSCKMKACCGREVKCVRI